MRKILLAAGAVVLMVLAETAAACVVPDRAGKLLCGAALAALVLYCVGRAVRRERETV